MRPPNPCPRKEVSRGLLSPSLECSVVWCEEERELLSWDQNTVLLSFCSRSEQEVKHSYTVSWFCFLVRLVITVLVDAFDL